MSKMTIIGPKAVHPGCTFEEWKHGSLRGCGRTSYVCIGGRKEYLCLNHAKYALSTQGEHYQLFDSNKIPRTQKAFLEELERAAVPVPVDEGAR